MQEAGGSEGRSCHLAVVLQAGPSREQQHPAYYTAARLGCRRTAHPRSFPLPMSSVVWFLQRQQETVGDSRRQRARKPRQNTQWQQHPRQGQLATQHSALDKRTAGAGGPISSVVDGQAGSSLLLVVRFCFGLLQPRSLAPLGNADKKVQAAWRRGGNELVLWRPLTVREDLGGAPFPNSSVLHLLHLGHR